jgi:menaquinone-dependent protoporphyrinogen oxidase
MSSKTIILYQSRSGTTEKAAKLLAEKLRNMALATGFFGGEFDFDRMNFPEKGIIKKVAGVSKSISNIKHQAIEDFAAGFNN